MKDMNMKSRSKSKNSITTVTLLTYIIIFRSLNAYIYNTYYIYILYIVHTNI